MEEISLRKHDNYQDSERKILNMYCEVEPNNTHNTHTQISSGKNVCVHVCVIYYKVCMCKYLFHLFTQTQRLQ